MAVAARGKWRRRLASARAVAKGMLGKWPYCVMCEHHVPAFLPWRGGIAGVPPLMRALDSIGSDPANFSCPRCRATDRERHLKPYLQRTGLAEKFRGARILHFAPEAGLAEWITTFEPMEYVS